MLAASGKNIHVPSLTGLCLNRAFRMQRFLFSITALALVFLGSTLPLALAEMTKT